MKALADRDHENCLYARVYLLRSTSPSGTLFCGRSLFFAQSDRPIGWDESGFDNHFNSNRVGDSVHWEAT